MAAADDGDDDDGWLCPKSKTQSVLRTIPVLRVARTRSAIMASHPTSMRLFVYVRYLEYAASACAHISYHVDADGNTKISDACAYLVCRHDGTQSAQHSISTWLRCSARQNRSVRGRQQLTLHVHSAAVDDNDDGVMLMSGSEYACLCVCV